MPKYGENIYHRKDGRWEARYIAMRLPNGKAKYKSVYGRTHDIAKKKQLAAMQALTHESAAVCELTLKELFSQYLLQTDVKLSTRERYRFMLERHILPHLGGIPVSRLTAKELSSFLLWMKQHGRLHSGGGLSAKTVRDLAVLIKTLPRFAQREYHCVGDALNAKLPACTQKKIDVFSEMELAVLGKALFPSKRISLAVMLALHADFASARSARCAQAILIFLQERFMSAGPSSASRCMAYPGFWCSARKATAPSGSYRCTRSCCFC